MSNRRFSSGALMAMAVVSITIAIWSYGAGDAGANGNSFEIFRERAGNFEVAVGVQPETPVIGQLHVTVTPLDASSGDPVTDATVTVVASKDDGASRYISPALNSPADPNSYDANFKLSSPGDWTLSVDVASDSLGSATFSVGLKVKNLEYSLVGAGFFVWLLTTAAFVGGGLYVWRSARRARERVSGP